MRLDDLITRLKSREKVKGTSNALATMKDNISTLRSGVVQLQSMDMSTLWDDIFLPDAPSFMPQISINVYLPSKQPKIDVYINFVDAGESERVKLELAERVMKRSCRTKSMVRGDID